MHHAGAAKLRADDRQLPVQVWPELPRQPRDGLTALGVSAVTVRARGHSLSLAVPVEYLVLLIDQYRIAGNSREWCLRGKVSRQRRHDPIAQSR